MQVMSTASAPVVSMTATISVTLSPTDGLRLFFGSNRLGTFGDDDVWIVERTGIDEPFGSPIHLGNIITTGGGEHAPEEPGDGLTLYFLALPRSLR